MAHVILFEHAQFHGQHKHVFRAEPNLNAGDDNFFNDKASSLVVVEGNWALFLLIRISIDNIRQFSGPVCILVFLQELKTMTCRRCSR
jgi:hypothetical protein